jgi:hypothetical protein
VKLGAEKLAAFGAVLVLLGGYLFAFRPLEAAIATRYAQLDDRREQLERRLALTRRAASLRREQQVLTRWLADAGLHADRTAIVDRFLGSVATRAASDGVHVTAITADAVALPAAPVAANAIAFDEIPLTVTLRGTYQRVLRFVRDLDATMLAERIGVESLGTIDRNATIDPELRATIHITLLRTCDVPENRSHGPI